MHWHIRSKAPLHGGVSPYFVVGKWSDGSLIYGDKEDALPFTDEAASRAFAGKSNHAVVYEAG